MPWPLGVYRDPPEVYRGPCMKVTPWNEQLVSTRMPFLPPNQQRQSTEGKKGSHLSKTWLTLRQFHIFTANSRQILLPFFYLFLTTYTENSQVLVKKTLLVLGTRRACSVHAEVPEGGRVVVGSG